MGLYERAGKRMLDVTGAGLMAVVTAPVMGVIAVALWRTQGRPILFRQQRVGGDDREFTIVKFRTMIVGAADQGDGRWVAQRPRITPLGAFLRSSSLDELPQLWNAARRHVAGGAAAQAARADRALPGATRRPARPARADLPRAPGRNNLRRSQMIELDQQYVRRITLGGDLRLLLRTVPVVLFRHGFEAHDESENSVEDVPPDGAAA